MTASVVSCDQKQCVFWREPNDCCATDVELESGECVTFATPEDMAAEEKWLEDKVISLREEGQP